MDMNFPLVVLCGSIGYLFGGDLKHFFIGTFCASASILGTYFWHHR